MIPFSLFNLSQNGFRNGFMIAAKLMTPRIELLEGDGEIFYKLLL